MSDQSEDGPHIHRPCTRCGLVEGEVDGLCPECATQVASVGDEAAGQAPDPATAELEGP